MTQFFLNMEIERYTLATGETALTGFSRFWRHWGLVFALMTYFANIWPGWATSSATLISYLVGGERAGSRRMLLVIGIILTMAPVVYLMLERHPDSSRSPPSGCSSSSPDLRHHRRGLGSLPQIVTRASIPVEELGFALLLGALAFAGAGGGQNLCQSNWIRDKGFGMGSYVPRIMSPVTGEPEAAPSTGYVFEPTAENLGALASLVALRQRRAAPTFVPITFLTIPFTSLLAYATVYGEEGLASASPSSGSRARR